MPRASKDTPAPTAVESEAITDAVEAAVEELAEMAQDIVDEATSSVVACIGDACEQFGHDKADRDVCLAGPTTGEGFPAAVAGSECVAEPQPKAVACIQTNCKHYEREEIPETGESRYICNAIPDELPTELDFHAGFAHLSTQPCIAPTLMAQVDAWAPLVENDHGQLGIDVDTDSDVRDQVRERLFNDVLKAQDAVSKAVDKLGDARQAQRAAETMLEKYDAWQSNVDSELSRLNAELRDQDDEVFAEIAGDATAGPDPERFDEIAEADLAGIDPPDDLANVPGAVEVELGLGDEEAVF